MVSDEKLVRHVKLLRVQLGKMVVLDIRVILLVHFNVGVRQGHDACGKVARFLCDTAQSILNLLQCLYCFKRHVSLQNINNFKQMNIMLLIHIYNQLKLWYKALDLNRKLTVVWVEVECELGGVGDAEARRWIPTRICLRRGGESSISIVSGRLRTLDTF